MSLKNQMLLKKNILQIREFMENSKRVEKDTEDVPMEQTLENQENKPPNFQERQEVEM